MKSDFGDWLSPMLVKELRQGMRSKVFMAAFYLTQLLMILAIIFNLAATDSPSPEMQAFMNTLFWLMISVPLILVMPIRGFASLHDEMKSGTIELVFLTRLTAWRIAAGKWTALMVQTLLLVCSVLPYVLLRYFLGGVNVVEDLQTLLFLLLACAALTALTIGLSPYDSKLLRALFIVGMLIGFVFLLAMAMTFMVTARFRGGMGMSITPWQIYAGVLLYIPAFIVLALEVAASRIAPPAENHAIRKRMIGIYFLLIAVVLASVTEHGEVFFSLSFLFLIPVIVDALAEQTVLIRSIYRPFLTGGALRRMAGGIFTPGWVSATNYVLLVSAISAVGLVISGHLTELSKILDHVSFLGWLIFPAAVIRLIMPDTKYFLGFYIALQLFFAAVAALVSMMAGITNERLGIWLSPIPNCVHFLLAFKQITDEQMPLFLTITCLSTGVALLFLMVRSFATRRDIRAVLGQS